MDIMMVTEQTNWEETIMDKANHMMNSRVNPTWGYINFDQNISANLSSIDIGDMYNNSCHEHKRTHYSYSEKILLVCLPIIILVGTIGNVLSIVVLRRRVMQMSAASFYLTILAFSDLSILYLSALKTWIRLVSGFELLHMSNAACKILRYIFFTSSHLSSWLVVAITIERLVVVRFPFKASQFCSYRQSVRITCTLGVVIMLLNVNVLGASELVVKGCNQTMCSTYLYSKYLYGTFLLLVYSLIPFVLVLSMNLMTILSIVKNNRHFKQQHQNNDQHTQISSISKAPRQASPEDVPRFPSNTSSSKEPELSAGGSGKCSNHKDSNATAPAPVAKKSPTSRIRGGPRHLVHQQRRLTCTLLTITVLWLLLTSPYAFFDLLRINDGKYPFIFPVIAYLLMYSNHAINFYIYCLTGRKFRSELRRAFCHEWKPPAYRKVPFKQSIPPTRPLPAIDISQPQKPTGGERAGGTTAAGSMNGTMSPAEKPEQQQPAVNENKADVFANQLCKTTKL